MIPFVRIWLPLVVTLAGIAVMVIGRDADALEGGAGIVGAGLAIWLLNFLYRVGAHDDVDRDEEDAARDFYDAHGHWPDEPAPPAAAPRGRRIAKPDPDRGPGTARAPRPDRGAGRDEADEPHRVAPPESGRRRPPARRRPSG